MDELRALKSDFVGQIAVAVWIGRLTDDAACEAIEAFASACNQREPTLRGLREALLAEYRHRYEGLELCN